jgi:urease accessory protein
MDRARIAVRSVIDRDHRAADRVGRDARLDIVFEERAGRTVIAREYAEPPFRVGRVFLQDDGGAHLIVASSAPGIFGGDALQQSVRVGPGARVRLTSQSALQIHPSGDGRTASLSSRYVVDAGAHLWCEWDPNIPFGGARLDQRISIDVGDGATLFWSDAVMGGREARGERWQFASLGHELRLTRDTSLIYLERYTLDPRHEAVGGPWTAASASYFGTVLSVGPAMSGDFARTLFERLAACADVQASVDAIEDGIVLVRLMARSGPAFHAARALVATAVQDLMVR